MSAGARYLAAMALAAAAVAVAAADVPAPRAEAAEWAATLEAPPARAGSTAMASLHVSARAGYHVNLDYPMAFRPAPESTAAFSAERIPLRPAAATPCQGRPAETCAVRLELPFTAPSKGAAHLAGTLAFSVCSADRCLIEKVLLGSN